MYNLYNNISKLDRELINEILVKRKRCGVYRRRRWRARAPFGHGVFVIHEAVQKSVVRVETGRRGLRRASQSAQRAQPCQASPATLRKLERSVRRNVLRCLCNPSEALPTFQIASG